MSIEKSMDGSYVIRKAITDKLIADFDYTQVTGLSSQPIFTRTVTPLTPEPYIYVYEVDSSEAWVSKTSESRLHSIMIQIMIRDEVGRGTSQQRDEMVNQVLENVTAKDDYPDPSGDGYRVQLVTTGNIVKYEVVERGAKFYIANIPLEVTAYYHGFDFDTNPVFNQTFSYAGWHYTPISDQLEYYDGGTIEVRDNYPDSNGWEYARSTVAKASGRPDGTLSGRVLTVADTDDDLGLTTTATFQAISDNTETTDVSDTDTFTRIVSFRYGTIRSASQPTFTDDNASSTGLRELEDWNTGNREVDFGNLSPRGDTFTVNGDTDDWIYLVYGSDQPALSSLTDTTSNQDVLTDAFENPIIVGRYRYYIAKNPFYYDGTTFTYEAG